MPLSDPIGSTAADVLARNAQDIDRVVNGGSTVTTRTGRQIMSIDQALLSLGTEPPVAFAAGISVTRSTQSVIYSGLLYHARPDAVPFTTTETFNAAQWTLREITSADLASTAAGKGAELVGVRDVQNNYRGATKTAEGIAAAIGLSKTFITADTTGVIDAQPVIQAAIDAVNPYKTAYQLFTKVIFIPAGRYKLDSSILHRNGVIIECERGAEFYVTGNFPGIKQSANTSSLGLRTYSSLGIRGFCCVGTNGTTNNAGGGLLNSNLSNQHGIYLQNDDAYNSASYLFVENCFIYNMGGNGIHVYKPAVSSSQFGWTQFGHFSDLTIQACGGWAIYCGGVTGSSDFASMETYRVHCQGNYAGGVYCSYGNDNKLRFTVNNTGTCVTPSGTFTNAAPGPSIQLEGQLNTQLWCHIENNNGGEGLVVGRYVTCYTVKIEGLFYTLASPIKLDKINGAKIGHAQFGTVPAGNYCIQTTTATRYLHIEKEWYKDTSGSLFLLDANAGTVYAATGYIGINAIGLGPANQLYSGLLSTSGEGIGYGSGSGGAVAQTTSKSTNVTSNTVTGQITTAGDSLAANTTVVFAVNCNKISIGDIVAINISSGPASPQAYIVRVARVGAGFFVVAIKNDSGGALAESLVLSYAVIKGAIS